jgi:hypothetical protein
MDRLKELMAVFANEEPKALNSKIYCHFMSRIVPLNPVDTRILANLPTVK